MKFCDKLIQLRKRNGLSQEELGEKLNVDIYLGAIFVFVGRMFNNLGFIRRSYIEKITKNKENKKSNSKTID